MKASFLCSLAAIFLAVLMGAGLSAGQEESPVPASSPSPTPTPSDRRVSEIVIHQAAEETYDTALTVTVSLDGAAQEMTLESYLVGVVLGEMPASFSSEALKAQAVAARTYTLQQLLAGKSLSDDPAVCQAFAATDTSNAESVSKVREAVEDTAGQVLTYDGSLITATYFSCSGGRTEDASAVWGGSVPYLTSVESPGEEWAACFSSTVALPLSEFLAALDISAPEAGAVTYTAGAGVDTMELGGKTFSGTYLRSLFSLPSTMFSLEFNADQAVFTVQGNGHRVGMSQYGAQAMAEAGSSYEEILAWYYTGAELITLE